MKKSRTLVALGLLCVVLGAARSAEAQEDPAQAVPRTDELAPERAAVRQLTFEREQAALEQTRQRQQVMLEREQTQLEQARRQLEQSRLQLEAAARDVATQSFSNLTLDGQLPATWQLFTSTPRGRLGIDVVDADRGALVTQVTPETPADEAGIEVGDFVRSVDGVSLTDGTGSPAERLADRLREIEAGATVGLIVERAGQPLEIDVVARDAASSALRFDAPRLNLNRELGNLENQLVVLTEEFRGRGGSPGINVIRTLGFAAAPWAEMELVALTEALGRYFNTSEGLLVVRAPSADAIDLQDGDVILTIGARTPNSPEHAMRILGSFEAGEMIALEIMREGSRYTSEYTVP